MNENNGTNSIPAQQWRAGTCRALNETVVVEEPLEIRLNGRRFSATMRTPQGESHDRWLALGLLFAEGVITELDDVENVTHQTRCRELSQDMVNVVDVRLWNEPQVTPETAARSLISNSSCGLCGKASVEAFSRRFEPLPSTTPNWELVRTLPDRMRQNQAIFERTGGLHAAAIFASNGELLACFEDIGRHNATDMVVGFGLERGFLPCQDELILLVSGRASFEIVQKCLAARIPTLAAVSAASSLAVELAKANRLNLAGFLRPQGITVY